MLTELFALQWYWLGFGTVDIVVSSLIELSELIALSVSCSVLVLSSYVFCIFTAADVIHAIALPSLNIKQIVFLEELQ